VSKLFFNTIVRPVIIIIISAVALVVLAALGIVLYRFNPESYGFFPKCPFFVLTGWQCPGCGTTRALHNVLHGHFGRAIAFNPILVLAVPFLLLLAIKPAWRYKPQVAWGCLIIAIAYFLLRNFVAS